MLLNNDEKSVAIECLNKLYQYFHGNKSNSSSVSVIEQVDDEEMDEVSKLKEKGKHSSKK